MDKEKALLILDEISNLPINGIKIDKYLNNGKSAAVFLGYKEDKPYAIKIFDNELLRQFGVEIQKQRIDLELSLKNHTIDNLVKIIDGGEINIKNTAYFYLVMNYIDGKNLKQFYQTESINTEFIKNILIKLVKVSEDLLKLSQPLAHRDIKPENIMVSNDSDIILMDLGVLKIIGNPSITDIGERHFLGTLRYAAPEFLTRKEEDSIDGWRAINIYQIGTVAHDLIMRKEIFNDIEPYSNLVIAIKEDMPSIINNDIHPDLIQLVRNMLSKYWKKRLEMCSIHSILETLNNINSNIEKNATIFNAIKSLTAKLREELDDIESITRSNEEKQKIKVDTNNSILNLIDVCVAQTFKNDIINDFKRSQNFSIKDNQNDFFVFCKFYEVYGKYEYGFNKPVFLLFKVETNENMHARISIVGILLYERTRYNIEKPSNLYNELILQESKFKNKNVVQESKKTIKLKCIFDGIIEIGDPNIFNKISIALQKVIEKAVEHMKPEVEKEVKQRKRTAQGLFQSIETTTSIKKYNFYISDFL